MDQRIKFDGVCFEVLAYHLVMYLAVGRYINFHITENFRLTAKTVAMLESSVFQANLFVFAQVTQVVGTGNDTFLCKVALHRFYLATAATRLATTDGIDINTQLPCSLQHRSSNSKTAAFSGGAEYYQCLLGCWHLRDPGSLGLCSPAPSSAATSTTTAIGATLGARFAVGSDPVHALWIMVHQHISSTHHLH